MGTQWQNNDGGQIDAKGRRIENLAAPVAASDAARKADVDAAAAGLDVKKSVRAATTANITLSGLQTIDGVVLSAGNRVLVKNQSLGAENGIYTAAAGAWARATDADSDAEVTSGMFTFIEEGTVSGDTQWVLATDDPIVVGTTVLVFTKFGPGTTDHSALSNLGADDHTQYALLAGRGGGQTLKGGTAGSNQLVLESTSHATKGGINHSLEEAKNFRLEILGADPAANAANRARTWYNSVDRQVKSVVDDGVGGFVIAILG